MKILFGPALCVLVFGGGNQVVLRAEAAGEAEIVISSGVLNVFHDQEGEQWMASVEYRFGEWCRGLRPWIGIAHGERQTTFASIGLVYSRETKNRFRFGAGFAPTFYERGNGRNLGSELEYYSFGEVGYAFKNDHMIGLRLGHLSNGGLANINPGVETLLVTYSLPLTAKK